MYSESRPPTQIVQNERVLTKTETPMQDIHSIFTRFPLQGLLSKVVTRRSDESILLVSMDRGMFFVEGDAGLTLIVSETLR